MYKMREQPIKQVSDTGIIRWRLPSGKLHCEHGPAIIFPSGTMGYYQYGDLHRIDGPAIINGTKKIIDREYWFKGKRVFKGDPIYQLIKRKEKEMKEKKEKKYANNPTFEINGEFIQASSFGRAIEEYLDKYEKSPGKFCGKKISSTRIKPINFK
jgi:hypothetical protein